MMVILGSSRPNRRGEVVGLWIKRQLEMDQSFEKDYVDVKGLDLPFYDEELSPYSFKDFNYRYKNPMGQEWADRVAESDAFFIITPEYNHGYPGVLKNALDWVGPEWNGKPVGIVSYSTNRTGGLRAVEQLRQVVVELGLVQVSQSFSIANIEKAFTPEGEPVEDLSKALQGVVNAIVELQQKLATVAD